jgi:hypothetical protein
MMGKAQDTSAQDGTTSNLLTNKSKYLAQLVGNARAVLQQARSKKVLSETEHRSRTPRF